MRHKLLMASILSLLLALGYGLQAGGGEHDMHGDHSEHSMGEHSGHSMGSGHGEHSPPEASPPPAQGGGHEGHGQAPATAESRKPLYWVDPMHPAYRSDKPGKAPDCGMDLVPVYPEEKTEGPPGTIRLTTEKRQMIGVKTAAVAHRPLTKVIRTVAMVDYDETKVREVRTKISGWVKQLFVDFTGKEVEKGQPLFTVYSPELVATQAEYLLAVDGNKILKGSEFPEVASSSNSLLEVSRKRLLLWDISPADIRSLEETRKPKTFLTLHSPIKGFVVHKDVFEGRYITPETELFRIADLSTVWVNADIYEYELPLVQIGQEARVTLSYYPGETIRGRVVYVYPYLNGETRTARVRVEVPNPDGKLKPQMYANLELTIDLGEPLVVPDEAILDSGAQKTAFVAYEDGRFEPRELQLGPRVDSYVAVLSGLQEGEKVVVSGNYLIDSESRLKSALAGMGHQHGAQ